MGQVSDLTHQAYASKCGTGVFKAIDVFDAIIDSGFNANVKGVLNACNLP